MKLKLGQIHDQISAIDQRMAKESIKYRNAVEKHENFQKLFEQFLSNQYEQVKHKLLELEEHEIESDQLKEKLADLQKTITMKSLHIYELESAWRYHKKSQLFLNHLSNLLKNDEGSTAGATFVGSAATSSVAVSSPASLAIADFPDATHFPADSSAIGSSASLASSVADSAEADSTIADSLPAASPSVAESSAASVGNSFVAGNIPAIPAKTFLPAAGLLVEQPNFNVDPTCDTPTLDDLISNYELYDQQEEIFVAEQYAHVTPARMEDFLDKLKRQNIRLLRHKLEHEKVTNIFEDAEKACNVNARNQATALAQQVVEVQRKLQVQNDKASETEQRLREVVQQRCTFTGADVESLKKFVQKLYNQIFKPTYEERSHVHMAKCMEEYVQSLLCQLYSYEPQILKKALRKNQK